MKARIFVSLFAMPFAAVGAWMLWSVGNTFHDAWRMQDWVQVEAELLDAGYERHSGDDSDTFEAYARYAYSFHGRHYFGDRVSLSGGADNIGDYQEELGRNLQAAHGNGQHILVYVDPQQPADAVIDRGVRWGLVGFKSIFILVFGGVGFGLLIAAWRAPREKERTDPVYAGRPWLLNDDWQSPAIRSNAKAALWAAWMFAVFWNAISSVAPFLAWREIVEKDNWVGLVALLFPLVGIGLLVWAVRRTLEWRRFGPAPVTLDPFPGSIGGHVGGTIDLRLPYDPSARFELTLTSVHCYESGSGKNRSQREKAVWQDSQTAHAEPGGYGTRLAFRFEVPAGLPESDTEHDDSYHAWRLNLAADLAGANLDRDYEIPVYATAQQARQLPARAVERARRDNDVLSEQAVRERLNFAHTPTGRRLFLPMGRYLGSSVGGMIVGTVFAAVGWFLVVHEGLTVFGSIFGGIGALVALLCLYAVLNSLEVEQAGAELVATRRILGIPVRRRRLPLAGIASIEKASNFQSQSGGKHVIYYTIRAVDRQGRKIVIGEGLRGEREANATISLLRRELGLNVSGDGAAPPSDESLFGPEILT